MSVAVWPAALPNPNRTGYQVQRQDPRVRRSGEQGPPRYRRRWSSVAKTVVLSIQVSRSGKATFDTFYEQTTAYGARPFWMPDPTTDGWLMLDSEGRPMQDHAGIQILLAAQWLCLFGDDLPVCPTSALVRQI